MKAFSKIPFFRILIPFLFGILFSVFSQTNFYASSVTTIVIGFLLLTITINTLKTQVVKVAWLIAVDFCLFAIGFTITETKNARLNPNHASHFISTDSAQFYLAELNELPIENEKHVKCYLKLLYVKLKDEYRAVDGEIIAYVKKPNAIQLEDASKLIVFKGKLNDISKPKNPEEFNYKVFLEHRQIYHSAYLHPNSVKVLNAESLPFSIWRTGLKIKSKLLTILKKSGLSSEAYGICAALLTGYDHDIDKTIMNAFSHSGTLHVLSVSGLHTGAIFLVLNYLFNLIDKNKRRKLLRLFFLTSSLWFFALITGFSAPVLRAVLMFNLFGFGEIYFRNSSSNRINILLVSAFILLLVNPFYLFEIGFLLSYFAIFGLIYFQPMFGNWLLLENKVLLYVWNTITASAAATLATLPITLFFFKQFPVWFFITNLVVVPVCVALLGLAILALFKFSFIIHLINLIVALLIGFIDFFNTDKYGFIDSIDFRLTDVAFLSILIPLVAFSFIHKKFPTVIFTVLVLIFWQLMNLFQTLGSKQSLGFQVYAIKSEPHYCVKNTQTCYYNGPFNEAYHYSVKSHLTSFNYPNIVLTKFNYFRHNTTEFMILDKPNYWPKMNYKNITGLVLSNNFKLSDEDLKAFPELRMIICDATNNRYNTKFHQELSRKFNLDYYDVSKNGAFMLALK